MRSWSSSPAPGRGVWLVRWWALGSSMLSLLSPLKRSICIVKTFLCYLKGIKYGICNLDSPTHEMSIQRKSSIIVTLSIFFMCLTLIYRLASLCRWKDVGLLRSNFQSSQFLMWSKNSMEWMLVKWWDWWRTRCLAGHHRADGGQCCWELVRSWDVCGRSLSWQDLN